MVYDLEAESVGLWINTAKTTVLRLKHFDTQKDIAGPQVFEVFNLESTMLVDSETEL